MWMSGKRLAATQSSLAKLSEIECLSVYTRLKADKSLPPAAEPSSRSLGHIRFSLHWTAKEVLLFSVSLTPENSQLELELCSKSCQPWGAKSQQTIHPWEYLHLYNDQLSYVKQPHLTALSHKN